MHTFSRTLQAFQVLRQQARPLVIAGALGASALWASAAHAGGVFVSVNVDAPGVVLRAVGAPQVVRQPVYVAQPVYAPQPVYVPQPVYAPQPVQVVYQPAPVYAPRHVVYEQPRVVYAPVYPRHHHHHHHHARDEWRGGPQVAWDDRGAARWEGRQVPVQPPVVMPRGHEGGHDGGWGRNGGHR